MTTTTTTLIVPGLYSSGPAHWQTWLEEQLPDAIRVIQRDWRRADLPEWASRVRREIIRHNGPVVIVAHSFGVLAAAQAAEDHRRRIAGALLVAPADPARFGIEDFIPQKPLGFPTVLVASTNDPWMTFDRAARLAHVWDAQLVALGEAGHINAEAGYGPWPDALALVQALGHGESLTPRAEAESREAIRELLHPRLADASDVVQTLKRGRQIGFRAKHFQNGDFQPNDGAAEQQRVAIATPSV